MTTPDRNGTNDAEAERVVVRDRRRIDPVTGQVRASAASPEEAAEAAPQPQPVPAPASDSGHDPAVSALEEQVEALTAEVAERTADLQRLSAEYANYRRRVDRDREAVAVNARVQLVSELLTVLDDVERAEAHGDLTGAFKAVGDKLVAAVQKQGLEAFGLVGDEFDPSIHEAVQHEESDATGPTVTVVSAVLRRGYRVADRVLRPAMVTVVDRSVEGPS